eukprot:TRINITY_DN8603_c0_g1_i1.p1 TRINITY_DN8603_c0_g1~~TRINITY_DN8603_c0_g1_i1.p1  ORF type:complete len:597 (-),score=186.36 TRINITY_DN8603_c0_g1_i1:247-2037(-)
MDIYSHVSNDPFDNQLMEENTTMEDNNNEMITNRFKGELTKKLNKIFESNNDDDKDFLESLRKLSTFYGKNNQVARSNLKNQIENRSITINKNFLNAFSFVNNQLERLDNDMNELVKSIDNMEENLDKTKNIAGMLINKTKELQKNQQDNTNKLLITDKYIERFQITEEEKSIIKEGKINEVFFEILKKMHHINEDAKILLRSQESQTSGLEIIDEMSSMIEIGFDKLNKWIKNELSYFASELIELKPMLKLAIQLLRSKRPYLLRFCVDEVETTRGEAITTSFIKALTVGGTFGIKPIDIHAHDPLRYVGDMSAWFHQTLASEFENMKNLFGSEEEKKNKEFSYKKMEDDSSVITILSSIFSASCRPFKIRIDQVLKGQRKADIVVVYKIHNLLEFYEKTISSMIGPDSPLTLTFSSCKHQSIKVFFDLVHKKFSDHLQQTPPPPTNLSPPNEFHQVIQQLSQICTSFDTTLVLESKEKKEHQFTPVINSLVDPLLKFTFQSCQMLTNNKEKLVFLINCFFVICKTIEKYDFAKKVQTKIMEMIDEHKQKLVEEETGSILVASGLSKHLNMIETYDKDTITPMDSSSISSTMDQI